MSDVPSGEQEFPILRHHNREEMMISSTQSTPTTTTTTTPIVFILQIPDDNVAFREMMVEEIQELISPLREIISEILISLHSLATEDQVILMEFSTGILVIHCILSTANTFISFFVEAHSSSSSSSTSSWADTEQPYIFQFINAVNIALANFDSIANKSSSNSNIINNVTSYITEDYRNDWSASKGNTVGNIFDSSLMNFILFYSDTLKFVSPTVDVMMIMCPLVLITLTCVIMADNKYNLFATGFGPIVDRGLLPMGSFFSYNRSDQRQHHRRIPNDTDESSSSEGVSWEMLLLLFFEGILIGSIVVLMSTVTFSLSILTSLSTMVSPHDNPALLEETTKIFILLVFAWVVCVLTSSVLRKTLYLTTGNDNDNDND